MENHQNKEYYRFDKKGKRINLSEEDIKRIEEIEAINKNDRLCKYYHKDNELESRCITDSSVGYCIIKKYGIECKLRCEYGAPPE